MARNVSAQEFVSVPVLNSDETVAMVRRLVAQSDPSHPVPALAQADLRDLEQAANVLTQSVSTGPTGKGTAIHDAYVVTQKAWGSLEAWLGAFNGLDDGDDPRVPKAKELYAVLFGQGLGFLKSSINVEWVESQRRIDAAQGLTSTFQALGGEVFWVRLRRAHDAEGKLAHLTSAESAGSSAGKPGGLALLNEAKASLRSYVLHVVASVPRGDASAQAIADHLLLPLTEWHGHKPTKSAPKASEGAPASNPPKSQA